MNNTSQTNIQSALVLLLEKIGATSKPITLIISPEYDAEINSCFYNVARKVDRDGGCGCYGWAIRLSEHLIEAEKHAIWKSPSDEYLDITPASHAEPQTVFVIDDGFEYERQLVDNVRINLSGNQVVDDWIAVCETINTLYSYGKRTGENTISLPDNIAQVIKSLEDFASVYEPFLEAGGSYSGSCFCGRPLAYNQCHGRDLKSTLSALVSKTEKSNI